MCAIGGAGSPAEPAWDPSREVTVFLSELRLEIPLLAPDHTVVDDEERQRKEEQRPPTVHHDGDAAVYECLADVVGISGKAVGPVADEASRFTVGRYVRSRAPECAHHGGAQQEADHDQRDPRQAQCASAEGGFERWETPKESFRAK
jgi:hypothetical protein